MSAMLLGAREEGKPKDTIRSDEHSAHRGERGGTIEPKLKGERSLVQQQQCDAIDPRSPAAGARECACGGSLRTRQCFIAAFRCNRQRKNEQDSKADADPRYPDPHPDPLTPNSPLCTGFTGVPFEH